MIRKYTLTFAFLALSTSLAHADCPVDNPFLSCTVKGGQKALEVCRSDQDASYWFGPRNGKAELSLTAKAGEFSYTPWPGVGRTIWEELAFYNNGVTYTVYGAHERIWPEDEAAEVKVITSGGVIVSQDGKELAHLRCDEGTVVFPW